jgi:hypothetical protein
MRGTAALHVACTGIACLNHEIVLTNDMNEPLMALAHTQANDGRLGRACSSSLANDGRAKRLRRAYKNVLIEELIAKIVAKIGNEQTDRQIDRIAGWIEREVEQAVVGNEALGLATEDNAAEHILYATNFGLMAIYNWLSAHLRHDSRESLREAEALLMEEQAIHPSLWKHAKGLALTGETGATFIRDVIGGAAD